MNIFIFAENYRAGRRFMDQHQMQTTPNICVISHTSDMVKMQGIENPMCIMLPGWGKNFIDSNAIQTYIKMRRGMILIPQ